MKDVLSIEDQKKQILACFQKEYADIYKQVANILNRDEQIPKVSVLVFSEGTSRANG